MRNRIITEAAPDEEAKEDESLRPDSFAGYIGQKTVKKDVETYIEAAKRHNESLDHVLLYGPPGLGKTTLANIIANAMGAKITVTSGPAIDKPGMLASLLAKMPENGVLFIDEIHRLPKQVEEILYPAMEDGAVDISIGKDDMQSKTIR